jgi:hypothetical protein
MREGLLPQIAMGAVVASSLGYLINQLPPIPDFPHKTEYLIGSVTLLTCLSIAIAIWQGQKESQKSSGVRQSNPRHLAPTYISTTNRQLIEIPSQRHPELTPPKISNPRRLVIPWNSLLILGALHFFPALVLGLGASSLKEDWALAAVLAGAEIGAWAWTGTLTWAWTKAGVWVGVLIVFLAGAGGWALFLVLFAALVWLFYSFCTWISSAYNSWSWEVALVLTGGGALVLAQAWYWIGALVLALALAGAVSGASEKLSPRFSQSHTFLILGLDSSIGMTVGGLIGWGLGVINHIAP